MPARKTSASTRKTAAQKTAPKRKTPVPKEEVRDHIRNLRRTPLRLRFPSQKLKDGDRGYELKPRGDRGDIIKVNPDDFESTYFAENLNLTFEALTATEAREIISKQSVNEQAQVHPAMAMLRNELGKEYDEKAVQIEIPYEQQGKVVAHVTMDGKRVNVDRNPGSSPTLQNVPGSQHGVGELAPDQLRDAVARDRNTEGPSAGLAGITKVTIGEVEKT